MNTKKSNPAKFLDLTELTALENETIKGGAASGGDIQQKQKNKQKTDPVIVMG